MLYGVEGIGKSTFGSLAPKPVYIQIEDGLDEIDCENFLVATTYNDVVGPLTELRAEQHDYQNVVIDWLDPLVWDKLCAEDGLNSIAKVDGGYSKGYTRALTYWRGIIDQLNVLRNACDGVLFATRCIRTQSEAGGFNRKRTVAHAIDKDGGERILRCVVGPTCVVKKPLRDH